MDELRIGRRYRVIYRLEGQRKDRVLVGKYAGWSRFYTQHVFDLRPKGGDTQLPGDAIISVEEISNG